MSRMINKWIWEKETERGKRKDRYNGIRQYLALVGEKPFGHRGRVSYRHSSSRKLEKEADGTKRLSIAFGG